MKNAPLREIISHKVMEIFPLVSFATCRAMGRKNLHSSHTLVAHQREHRQAGDISLFGFGKDSLAILLVSLLPYVEELTTYCVI